FFADRPDISDRPRDHAGYVNTLTTPLHRSATDDRDSVRHDIRGGDISGGWAQSYPANSWQLRTERAVRWRDADGMAQGELPHVRDTARVERTDPAPVRLPEVGVDAGPGATVGGTVVVVKETATVSTITVFRPVVEPMFVVQG